MAYRPYQSKRNRATQQAIGDALLDLLRDRQFSDVTITELCEAAGVSRPTFYRHFDAMEDVLGYYAQRLFDDSNARVRGMVGHGNSGHTILEAFFASFLPYRELFEVIRRNGLFGPLMGHLWILMGYPIWQGDAADAPQGDIDLIVYNGGGAFSLAIAWAAGGMQRTPGEMADTVIRASELARGTFAPGYHAFSTLVQNAVADRAGAPAACGREEA